MKTRASPKRAGARGGKMPATGSLLEIPWKKLKIVKPNPMSESDVRMVAMRVRSAAMRVRWTERLVRSEAIFSLAPRSS